MTDDDFAKIFHEMDVYLHSRSAYITFLQLRVASEFNIVWQCAWAIHHALPTLGIGEHHIYFEKELSFGKPDLLLVPVKEGLENFDNAFILEFTIACPGGTGIKSCSDKIRYDLNKLKGKNKGFVLAFLFAFEQTSSWTPYQSMKQDLYGLEREIYKIVGCEPFLKGARFPMITDEGKGKGRLVAWKAIVNEGN